MCFALGHEGRGDEWHLSIDFDQLKIGPRTETLDGGILVAEELTSAALHGGVNMGEEVVAVVDDGVVVGYLVVLV